MPENAQAQLPLSLEEHPAHSWAVRESRRARRLAIRVFHSGRVEVVVPRRTPRRAVVQFLDGHREWIESKLEHARRHALVPEPFPPSRIELAACGRSWRVHLAGGKERLRVQVSTAGLLILSGDASDGGRVRMALRAWLAERAREYLAPALAACAHEMHSAYRRIEIRWQRTRWGSCSTRGTISLNGCLLFQRPPVLRYLLVHELAHTRHMNHSDAFWADVARFCPEHARLDAELLDGWRRVPSWVHGAN
jgi:predicted metal-dependent hydrolase